MKSIKFAAMLVAGAVAAPQAAQAAVVINIYQDGANVRIDADGFLDLTQLTAAGVTAKGISYVTPNVGLVSTGLSGGIATYSGFTGPAQFGTSTRINANSSTGASFQFYATNGLVYVKQGYVSGTTIASSALFNNRTLFNMGFTSGRYDYSAGNEMVTVNIGSYLTPPVPGVPEPASWAMMMLGMGIVGGAMRARLRVSRSVSFA